MKGMCTLNTSPKPMVVFEGSCRIDLKERFEDRGQSIASAGLLKDGEVAQSLAREDLRCRGLIDAEEGGKARRCTA